MKRKKEGEENFNTLEPQKKKRKFSNENPPNVTTDNNTENYQQKAVMPRRGQKFETPEEIDKNVLKERTDQYYGCMTQSKSRKKTEVSEGLYLPQKKLIRITKNGGGKLLLNMGHRSRCLVGEKYKDARVLLPEECLFLMERSLFVLKVQKSNNNEEEIESVQDAFHFFLNDEKCLSLNNYIVYSYLKNTGFIVHRHDFEKKFKKNVDKSVNVHKNEEIVLLKNDDDNDEKEVEEVVVVEQKSKKKKKKKGISSNNENNENFEITLKEDGSEKVLLTKPYVSTYVDDDTKDVNERKEIVFDDGNVPLISQLGDIKNGDIVDVVDINNSIGIVKSVPDDLEECKSITDEDLESKIVFDVWKRSDVGGKKVFKYCDLENPSFCVIVTKYSDMFPSMAMIYKICEKYNPTPVYFGIIESGHVSFMQLSHYNIPSVEEFGNI